MKGIVFTEFMDHVEAVHGPLVLDDIILRSKVATHGAYTSVGTYPCAELVSLIGATSEVTGDDMPDIIVGLGKRLAHTFRDSYPAYYQDVDYFDFVECVEGRIHVDVLKLYPDAELPRFETVSRQPKELVTDYISSRRLEHLALGLLEETALHFDETVAITMQPFEADDVRVVRFRIVRS